MSYITRTGNLTKTPELRHGEKGAYAFARVAVTDRIKAGTDYIDGPATYYDVAISGSQAENLVDVAQACGNIRVTFSGSYQVKLATLNDGQTRIEHKVQAHDISISLRGQKVRVLRENTPAPQSATAAAQAAPAPQAAPTPQQNPFAQPTDPWAGTAPATNPIDQANGRWTGFTA